MIVTAQQIKELREETGAGVSEVKKALEESEGDMSRARVALERRLGNAAGKRAGRETRAGVVDAYIHSNNKIGVLVELFCETDFVARNPDFRALAHDVALHIAAMSPAYLTQDSVPADIMTSERQRCIEEAKKSGKSAEIQEQIVDGKLKSHFGALSLMDQQFVKDSDKTVDQVVREAIGRFGENIKVGRFVRFEL